MSRSAQAIPLRLIDAEYRIRCVLDGAERPLTAKEVADALRAEGYEWPLVPTMWNGRRYTAVRPGGGKVTVAKVRNLLRRDHRVRAERAGGVTRYSLAR